MTTLAASLTTEQAAIVANTVTLNVNACAGAGKTRTMVARLEALVPQLGKRKGICAVSFTKTAVTEFKERCHKHGLGEYLAYPSFCGTFDSFIFNFLVLPMGSPYSSNRPIFLESWDEFTVGAGRAGIAVAPISLGCLKEDGTIDINKVERTNQTKVSANLTLMQNRAVAFRNALMAKGYLSPMEARKIALARLSNAAFRASMSECITSRFFEVIVDEAQDCNLTDIELLKWLKETGIPLKLIHDPQQAIFEFRGGTPAALGVFAATLPSLALTNNFRSSPAICLLAGTLKPSQVPDVSAGEEKNNAIKIQLISYETRKISPVRAKMVELLTINKVLPQNSIVLSHQQRWATTAAGGSYSDSATSNKILKLLEALFCFHQADTIGELTTKHLKEIFKIILIWEGVIQDGETFAEAIVRLDISEREWRRRAMSFLEALPKIDCSNDAEAEAWITQFKQVCPLHIVFPTGRTVNRVVTNQADIKTSLLSFSKEKALPFSTIHAAKGREYEAVCMVIPTTRNDDVCDLWMAGDVDREALRVLYVGATRAKKLLSIAIPKAKAQAMQGFFVARGVPFEYHELT